MLTGLVAISFSVDLISLKMTPNDATVTIQSFDGFTSYPWVSALLLVQSASLLTSFFVSKKTQLLVISFGWLSALLLLVFFVLVISFKDTSALTSQIESATGIAVNHGLDGVEVTIENGAWLALAATSLALGYLTLATLNQNKWQTKSGVVTKSLTKKPASDSISLWDSQR